MSAEGTDVRAVDALREENERLRAQLHRIVADLHDHADMEVRVDLDAPPGNAMVSVRSGPGPQAALGGNGLDEVHEVAERLLEDFRRDIADSDEITLARWRRRPAWEKIAGPFVWILERQQ